MLKVLIVDDDENNRAVAYDALEDEGYELSEAVDGRDALSQIERILPDLILLDVMMPEIDGYEVLRQLKSKPETKHMPVIMLTALNMDSQVAASFNDGAIDHIAKPFSNMVLRARVRSALRSGGEVRPETASPRSSGKKIAFIGAKGGVGTSTVALNVATALAEFGEKTIAANLEPDTGTIGIHLGVSTGLDYSQALDSKTGKFNISKLPECLTKHPTNLQVLLGPQADEAPKELSPAGAESIINGLAGLADFTIVDLPHYHRPYVKAVARAANYVVLVVELEYASLAAAAQVLKRLKSWGIGGHSLGVVATSRAQVAMPLNLSHVRSTLDCDLIGVIPAAPDDCLTAETKKTPLIIARPSCMATGALKTLAQRLEAEQVEAISF